MQMKANKGEIFSLNISLQKGEPKHPVESIALNELGIIGDIHAGRWHRQISLLDLESITSFSKENDLDTPPGIFAENITTQGLSLKDIKALDYIDVLDEVSGELLATLQITQIGKKCHNQGCSIFSKVGDCIMPKSGIFARVCFHNDKSLLRKSCHLVHRPYIYQVHIITMSDRAFQGIYEDLSGPEVTQHLKTFFAALGDDSNLKVTNKILADDPKQLDPELLEAVFARKMDAVFITGGTGIGSRDITPEVVMSFADKIIPGIMEAIRIKHSEGIPAALLSRSVAAVKNKTVIYAIPGSPKAVKEYLPEILKTFKHVIYMLNDLSH